MKLTTKQKEVIKLMRDGENIMISRYSDNRILSGTRKDVSESDIDKFIDLDIITYSHETDIHNVYILTPLGLTIDITK